MKLYEYYRSSCSYRLRIALNIKGIEAEQIHVNLLEGEQKTAEYRAINPQGTVPTLVDGGAHIHQSLAALEYLEETHPTPAILPKNVADRAYVRSLALAVCCNIQPFNNLSTLHYIKETLHASEEQSTGWIQHWITRGFATLEPMLEHSGDYCYRDQVTLADICLIPQVYNALRFHCDMAAFPKIAAIYERCLALPAFDAARPEAHPAVV